MKDKPDGFEGSARIVEALAASASVDKVDLLGRVAEAIRDRAIDD